MRARVLRTLVCGVGLACLSVLASCSTTPPSNETPKAQYERVKADYQQKKSQGRDVSAIDPLIPQLRAAIESRDLPKARQLLDDADQKLKSVK